MRMTVTDGITTVQQQGFDRGSAAEWLSMGQLHPNALLEGSDPAVDSALQLLTPHLGEPVVWTDTSLSHELPTGAVGALVLRDVGDLGEEQQALLLNWLDVAPPATQVLSTTARPLFPRVTAGLFNPALYYRINTRLLTLA